MKLLEVHGEDDVTQRALHGMHKSSFTPDDKSRFDAAIKDHTRGPHHRELLKRYRVEHATALGTGC